MSWFYWNTRLASLWQVLSRLQMYYYTTGLYSFKMGFYNFTIIIQSFVTSPLYNKLNGSRHFTKNSSLFSEAIINFVGDVDGRVKQCWNDLQCCALYFSISHWVLSLLVQQKSINCRCWDPLRPPSTQHQQWPELQSLMTCPVPLLVLIVLSEGLIFRKAC